MKTSNKTSALYIIILLLFYPIYITYYFILALSKVSKK